MEPDRNLDSIRELSHSQLEALLRYESPPETPIRSTDAKSNNSHDMPKTCESLLQYNREQFDSQIGSQIDFSVFQHDSLSANNWSMSPLNETEDCVNVSTPLKTIEIPDITMREKNENYFVEGNFKENDFDINFGNNKDGQGKAESAVTANSRTEKIVYDFGEADEIFKTIDFDNNMQISQFSKLESPNGTLRKCQTQLESKTAVKDVQTKIVSSCPAKTRNHFQPPKTLDKELNKLNEAVKMYSSLHKISNNEAIVMDDHFEKASSAFTFGCSNSLQKQTQAPILNNSFSLSDKDFSQDHPSEAAASTPKSFAKLNTFVDTTTIPCSVKQLYDIVKTNYSDFAFIYALSSQLCQDRVPMECFVTLKIALLLSLVSIGNNENRPPIPIVALSNDTYMTDYLMTNIGQLGSRFLGPVDETKSFASADWIEADSIILASGGVFYAGDWTRLKLRRAETIFRNIECSSVAVDKTSLNFPLETAIWTHWRSFKYGTKDQQTFNKFLKIFGLPVFVADDNHEALIDYILDQASVRVFESTIDHLSINQEDMRNFLICVSQNNVDLAPEAAVLLKDYFVASRAMRPDCLSTQSYTMLKQFAESFAKLSMRKVVLTGDALAAIIMCEHFIEYVFSPSDYCPPHFGKFDFVGAVDEYLSEFKQWLDAYIKKSQTKC